MWFYGLLELFCVQASGRIVTVLKKPNPVRRMWWHVDFNITARWNDTGFGFSPSDQCNVEQTSV